MKDELKGRVGCVRTRKVGDYIVQNFALCVEKVVENGGLPFCRQEWHNVFAEYCDEVKSGDVVIVIGLWKNREFIHNGGYTRIREFVAERLTIIKE